MKDIEDEINSLEQKNSPDEEVFVTIAETEIYWLFDQQPYFMSTEDEWAELQMQHNEDYRNVCSLPTNLIIVNIRPMLIIYRLN